MSRTHTITVAILPRTDYRACWELQQKIFAQRCRGMIGDVLLLTEHRPVYTMGTGGNPDHLLASIDDLAMSGADFVHTDRGGDITFHGPGQLVGYPILDLDGYSRDLHRYLRDLEEVVIRSLAPFGVTGRREPGYTGVWAGGGKICAIGVRSSRWVTMHGFALNVSTDLSSFSNIIPCGIFDRGVTSLEAETCSTIGLEKVTPVVVGAFGDVFDAEMVQLARVDEMAEALSD